MKLRILVLFLVCCLKAEAQSNSVEANSNIYQRAFEYIKQDSINVGINIAVSDSIVDLDWNGFDGLDEYKDENADLDNCRNRQVNKNIKPYYSPALHELHNSNKHAPQKILFFSPIENNLLRADLHVFNLQYLYNNDWYIWGECIEYLVLLDENGHCKKVLKRRVILN